MELADATASGCALALAEAAQAPATRDVPVGAIVVDAGGRVIGRGATSASCTGDPTAHAEVLALRAAARGHGRLAARPAAPSSSPSSRA